MSNKPKSGTKFNPKPATRLQATVDDSNSEDSQVPEEQRLLEKSYVEREEFRTAMDSTNAILGQLLQLQQDNANTQRMANEKIDQLLSAQKEAILQTVESAIKTKMDAASEIITEKVESKLRIDLKAVGDSMYSIQARLHELETTGSSLNIQESPLMPQVDNSFRRMPVDTKNFQTAKAGEEEKASIELDRSYALQLQMSDHVQMISQSINAMQARIHSLEEMGSLQTRKARHEGHSVPGSNISTHEQKQRVPLHDAEEEDLSMSSKFNKSRRDSAVWRIEDDELELMATGPKRIAVDSDKHLYIKWKQMTLDSFLNFLDDIDLFQKTYDQKVSHIYTHISKDIQQEIKGLLLMHKSSKFRDIRDVHKATLRDIYNMAQLLFLPLDLATFNDMLFQSCRPYAV